MSTIPVRCGSRTRRTTPRRPAGHPTRISWCCRGKSRACTLAATTTSLFPKPVYFSRVRKEGQPFSRDRPGLRQGLPHRQLRRRAAAAGGRERILVHLAPADQELRRPAGRVLGQAVCQERPLPGTRLHSGDGHRSVGEADDRMAKLRRDRHDEQLVREHGAEAEISDCRTSTPTCRDRKTICFPDTRRPT